MAGRGARVRAVGEAEQKRHRSSIFSISSQSEVSMPVSGSIGSLYMERMPPPSAFSSPSRSSGMRVSSPSAQASRVEEFIGEFWC